MPRGSKQGPRRLTPMYCAGLLDGEGTVSIRKTVKKGSDTYTVYCSISNTYLPILSEIQDKYGGKFYKRDNRGFKICGVWVLLGYDAVRFLRRIHRFTIIKNDQIKIALAFWKHKEPHHGSNKDKPDGFIEKCREFHYALKSMHGGQGKPEDKIFLPEEEVAEQMKVAQ